jgi:hypothetical protein
LNDQQNAEDHQAGTYDLDHRRRPEADIIGGRGDASRAMEPERAHGEDGDTQPPRTRAIHFLLPIDW